MRGPHDDVASVCVLCGQDDTVLPCLCNYIDIPPKEVKVKKQSLCYGKYKQIGQSGIWQVAVTGNGVTVICRLKAGCSHFEFLWSSRKISLEAQKKICDDSALNFWG
jgi:hypothetical protein